MNNMYNKLYNLSYITRYSAVPRVKNESVAEHSFYVASIVIMLSDTYKFDVGKAVTMAVIHDWPEAWLGDITVAVKREYPAIKDAVNIAEEQVVKDNFGIMTTELWLEHTNKTSIESLIVHLADVMQCKQYAEHEIKLGNDGYMREVLELASSRQNEIEELLHVCFKKA